MNEVSVSEQLEQMTSHPRVARAILDGLRQLRTGVSGSDFAELARDVLEGRVMLRDLGRTEAYGPQFRQAFHRFEQWEAGQDPEEFGRMVERTRATLEDDPV
ncbi:hypothetical protein [Actinoplanes aureus]|uniref:Uncharacterized protein n=1 Tax=Actinoplanes aureus TaxID=2792083 RepID=A0A931C7N9_9ACTN|nr:hypothetical protein [Actinoplanes aureus]MBG0564935.1 hypothetical protein [Actinoplanes aureus]